MHQNWSSTLESLIIYTEAFLVRVSLNGTDRHYAPPCTNLNTFSFPTTTFFFLLNTTFNYI